MLGEGARRQARTESPELATLGSRVVWEGRTARKAEGPDSEFRELYLGEGESLELPEIPELKNRPLESPRLGAWGPRAHKLLGRGC